MFNELITIQNKLLQFWQSHSIQINKGYKFYFINEHWKYPNRPIIIQSVWISDLRIIIMIFMHRYQKMQILATWMHFFPLILRDIAHFKSRLCFITLRKPCNNQRPRCDIARPKLHLHFSSGNALKEDNKFLAKFY